MLQVGSRCIEVIGMEFQASKTKVRLRLFRRESNRFPKLRPGIGWPIESGEGNAERAISIRIVGTERDVMLELLARLLKPSQSPISAPQSIDGQCIILTV